MKNNRINLRLLCALSSIFLFSNCLQAMTVVQQNVEVLKKTNSCEGCNLAGANLQGANLQGANLSGANLKMANLKGANLNETDLRYANLEGASVVQVYFAGAKLEGANLTSIVKFVVLTDEEIIASGATLNNKTTLPSGKKYSK